jgi:uncharacterized 2Fe-2S/4Fe-4S cluster protein (DUF4445 family)
MRATNGAIMGAESDADEIHLKVMGEVRPIGICGSGIVDLLGVLRRRQIIGPRGELLAHPLVRVGPRGREFVLASAEAGGTEKDLVVTQRDIGEIQLAKAAIRAGIDTLLTAAGISEDEIDDAVIAGAFGNSLNVRSAADIGLFPPALSERLRLVGLFPPALSERLRLVGNAAGAGARLALISKKNRATAAELPGRIHYLELTTHPQFRRRFAHALPFPVFSAES